MKTYSIHSFVAIGLVALAVIPAQGGAGSASSRIQGATSFLSGPPIGQPSSPYEDSLMEGVYAQAFGRTPRSKGQPHYEEGSLWSDASWFNSPHEFKPVADFEIGDIIVVEVQENFKTRDDIKLENEVESDLKFNIAKLWSQGLDRQVFGRFGEAIDYPQTSISGQDDYSGESKFKQRSELTIELPCTVRKILPDGRLMIEGRSSRIIARERKNFLLSGIVDPEDIDPIERTVPSTRVAESQIRWEGKGPGQDTLKPGLVNRILDYIPLF